MPHWLRNGLGRLIPARGAASVPANTKNQTTLARGHRAETTAAEYLMQQGLKLIDRNVRAGRGEIDLIMRDGPTLVFVEVRARKVGAWVSAEESISRSKRQKVIETAERLLNEKPDWRKYPCRFDVVAIGLSPGRPSAASSNVDSEPDSEPDSGPDTDVNWIRDAFQAE
jgi:putative endonuclease